MHFVNPKYRYCSTGLGQKEGSIKHLKWVVWRSKRKCLMSTAYCLKYKRWVEFCLCWVSTVQMTHSRILFFFFFLTFCWNLRDNKKVNENGVNLWLKTRGKIMWLIEGLNFEILTTALRYKWTVTVAFNLELLFIYTFFFYKLLIIKLVFLTLKETKKNFFL